MFEGGSGVDGNTVFDADGKLGGDVTILSMFVFVARGSGTWACTEDLDNFEREEGGRGSGGGGVLVGQVGLCFV